MSDRELLEAAAKAVGIPLYWSEDDPECDWVQGTYPRIPDHKVLEKWTWKVWNPLTDDGDALRLAVKLRHELGTDVAQCFGIGRFDEYKNDPYAATRRAIVRAAAELERSKK